MLVFAQRARPAGVPQLPSHPSLQHACVGRQVTTAQQQRRRSTAAARAQAHDASGGSGSVCGAARQQDDILQLNVGGEHMVASRRTLQTVPGSRLSSLFSPANAHLLTLDGGRRVFLDFDARAFSLALRFLRALKLAGGRTAEALLPPIPPEDAEAFRSLAAYLGLPVTEGAVAAAEARGAAIAIAAAGASAAAQRPPPAAALGQPAGAPAPSAAAARARGGDAGFGPARSASPYASRPAPGSVDSGRSPAQQQHKQWWERQMRQQQLMRPPLAAGTPRPVGSAGGPPLRPAQPPPPQPHRSGHGGASVSSAAAAAAAMQPQWPSEARCFRISCPTVPDPAAGAAQATPSALPLPLAVLTDDDVRRGDGPAACDVLCCISGGRHLQELTVIAQPCGGEGEGEGLFLGVTGSNYTDQKGLQIPGIGWWRDEGAPGGRRGLWSGGDLVQLSLELGPGGAAGGRLTLRVNGEAAGPPLQVPPCVRPPCFFAVLRRGSRAAAVLFEQGAVSVYTGDQRLKRYL